MNLLIRLCNVFAGFLKRKETTYPRRWYSLVMLGLEEQERKRYESSLFEKGQYDEKSGKQIRK